jgi:hypothetical protein
MVNIVEVKKGNIKHRFRLSAKEREIIKNIGPGVKHAA